MSGINANQIQLMVRRCFPVGFRTRILPGKDCGFEVRILRPAAFVGRNADIVKSPIGVAKAVILLLWVRNSRVVQHKRLDDGVKSTMCESHVENLDGHSTLLQHEICEIFLPRTDQDL